MSHEAIITQIKNQTSDYKHQSQAENLANSLDTISDDIYSESERFIYELIQNADDASNEGQQDLEINIEFTENYVVISHNGRAFNEKDILAISSVGKSQKSENPNQTGYKGIGFKSVFGKSDCVYINSNGFCFRYDRKYWQNQAYKMPWQIIPLWSDISPELDKTCFGKLPVSTAIQFDKDKGFNKNELKQTLINLFSNSQIMLFLRNVTLISVDKDFVIHRTKDLIVEKQMSETEKFVLSSVSLNTNTETTNWIIGDFIGIKIENEIKNVLKYDEKAPKRLKESQFTNISFAGKVNHKGELVEIKDNSLIFTYLPTKIKKGLPFLVNADFMTNAPREGFHVDRPWNIWLFGKVAYKTFEWLKELAQTEYKYQIGHLIPTKFQTEDKMEKSFNESYNHAIQTIAFIPNKNQRLLKVGEAIFDKTRITNFINPELILKFINHENRTNFTVNSFIDYIKPLTNLSKLGVKMFEIQDLSKFFTSNIFIKEHCIEDNFKLISFLYQQAQTLRDEDSHNWTETMRATPFIFEEELTLKSPRHIYFPSKRFSSEFINSVSVIHPDILEKIENNPPIKNWLENLGVREPSEISFIEKTIIEQASTYITKTNTIEVTRFLFNAHKKASLQPYHYVGLQQLPLLSKKGTLVAAGSSFLPNFYDPSLKLETSYNEDFYVSEIYPQHKDLNINIEWKLFFLKIGVNEDISIITHEKQHKDNLMSTHKYALGFFITYSGPISYPNWHYKSYQLTKITFIEITQTYAFACLFWQNVVSKYSPKQLQKNSRGFWGFEENYGFISGDCLPSYCDWFIKNHACIPTSKSVCYRPHEVYINDNEIQEIAGNYLPVFDFDEPLSLEWRSYFGFITEFGLAEYLKVLGLVSKDSHIQENVKANHKRIGLIYSKIMQKSLHQDEKTIINNWGKSNKLLAKDGNYYLPTELVLITVSGFEPPIEVTKNFIDTCGHKAEELKDVLTIFGVNVIDDIGFEVSNDKTEMPDLKRKLNQILPLLALIPTKNKQTDWQSEFHRLQRKLSFVHFYRANNLNLKVEYKGQDIRQKRSSWSEKEDFYYTGDWNSPRVLDGLVEPLCKFLKIGNAERQLIVLVQEIYQNGLEYLKEKEYDIDLIPEHYRLSQIDEPNTLPNANNRPYNSSDEELGRKGEQYVYSELRKTYELKYNKPIIDTLEGFRIEGIVEVFWRNISENSTQNHDFKIIELGKEIYVDSKATPYGEYIEKVAFYISPNEFMLMETSDTYLIARVYNVTSTPSVKYIKMQIERLK